MAIKKIPTRMQFTWDGSEMRLTKLPDGFELAPPWAYSKTRNESLGGERYQVVIDSDMSDEEIGRLIRSQAGTKPGRETLLDVRAWTPTLNS